RSDTGDPILSLGILWLFNQPPALLNVNHGFASIFKSDHGFFGALEMIDNGTSAIIPDAFGIHAVNYDLISDVHSLSPGSSSCEAAMICSSVRVPECSILSVNILRCFPRSS